VAVMRRPRGLRQPARSISRLSPIDSRPDAFFAMKIASLIFRPVRRFLAFTSLQSRTRPNFSFGSSSLISRWRQSFALSRACLRPPGNIQRRSRLRLTSRTRPFLAATSFDDFAIPRAFIQQSSAFWGFKRFLARPPHKTRALTLTRSNVDCRGLRAVRSGP